MFIVSNGRFVVPSSGGPFVDTTRDINNTGGYFYQQLISAQVLIQYSSLKTAEPQLAFY